MAGRKKPLRRNFYSPKRRAVYAQGDEIDHVELFDRCNWMCGICLEPINPKLRFPSIMAATVDHIIPISRGGLHIWENVRAAHGRCNFQRGDSMAEFEIIIIA